MNINKLTDTLARSSWSNCPLLDAMCELFGLQNLTQGLRQPALAYMGICSRTGSPFWRGYDIVYLEPRQTTKVPLSIFQKLEVRLRPRKDTLDH